MGVLECLYGLEVDTEPSAEADGREATRADVPSDRFRMKAPPIFEVGDGDERLIYFHSYFAK